ncbi:MAG: serine protease, partial [Candidatus Omnitrophica bacterium]|nr:serine protease [Candidatus Omnitrophota bacterium]
MKQETSLTDAVVKVFVTFNRMDYYRPWQSKGIRAGGGSGAIIKGNRILTNAHVVADHTFIQVKKDSDPKKYTAKVVAIGHDCDLALLQVDDPDFFDGVTPLAFGDLPKQQDSVLVIGYPQGGGKISITEGVVSRVEVTAYVQSSRHLLTVQIDAAINPGNSGGPVIQDEKIVGIAMQIFQSGDNIGYMIPVPVIQHFLKDLDDGGYEGFPMLGIDYKNTENATLREFYGIIKEEGGILVNKVLPFSPASGNLEEGDVILEINGVPIGEDGTFPFRGNERLSLIHLITKEHVGDTIA